MKEADASLMTVLNNLFIPLSKKRVKDLNEADSRYVSRLSHEIDSCGRESAIATGNYDLTLFQIRACKIDIFS